MKQRVGIARAFAIQPKMLLLDEPFGALDALTRGTIQDELVRICAATHQTVFMITHDVDEAILLADRILLMSNGPRAGIAEIVVNTLPRRARAPQLHHDPQYYRIRNHLVDFLVTARSSSRPGEPARPRRRAAWCARARARRRRRTSRQVVTIPKEDARDETLKRIRTSPRASMKPHEARGRDRPDRVRQDEKGIKWADVAKKVGQSKEWTTAACLGQMQMTRSRPRRRQALRPAEEACSCCRWCRTRARCRPRCRPIR